MNVNVPHFYWLCDHRAITGGAIEGIPAKTERVIVHAVQSRPCRLLCFHALFDFGAHYSGLPLHAFYHAPPTGKQYAPDFLQLWSCFDDDPAVIEYDYLGGKRVSVMMKDRSTVWGTYCTTIYWPSSAFTRESTQYKEGHLILLDNGQIALQPNNRLVWHDPSWTGAKMPQGLSVVNPRNWVDPEAVSTRWTTGDGAAFYYSVEGS